MSYSIDVPVHTYLDDLASAQPAPGGGSTAALSGAMAAALVCMVARLTLDKPEYAAVQAEVQTIIQQVEQIRSRFQQLVQDDIVAYGHLSAAFKLPRTSPQEKEERTSSIQSRLVSAALVPLEMAERAAQLMQHCQRIAEIGNKNVLSDIGVAALQTSTAATSAAWMVRVNLHSLKDQERADEIITRLNAALQQVSTGSQQVVSTIGARS